METKILLRTSLRLTLLPSRRYLHPRYFSSLKGSLKQANPIGDYYALILESSSPAIISQSQTIAPDSSSASASSIPLDQDADTPPLPSIIFSSRLSSPLERQNEIQKKSTLVAGVWVPPRPDEPDNCCMSGCVNCVWDRYGEELEEWALKRKEADIALAKEKEPEQSIEARRQTPNEVTNTPAMSLDDGDGSETNWGTGLETSFTKEAPDDLFKNVPVGIREFMRQEKRLKEKHAREGTSSG